MEWLLLRHFLSDDAGEPDWRIFERGSPGFLVEVVEFLQAWAKKS